MSNVADIFGLTQYKGFLLGCEFEIEDVLGSNSDAFPSVVHIVEDNSLRNNGREFVTQPCTMQQAIEVHSTIFNNKKAVKLGAEPCTERCSTHVHVNFSDQPWEKVVQFIRLYALVEPIFFQHVNADRQNNIYCVPLSTTGMLYSTLNYGPEDLIYKWHKYCALNVKRLGSTGDHSGLGTIEFRHFEATPDTARFSMWLLMIKGLYDFNLNNDIDETPISQSILYKLVNAVSPIHMDMETINETLEEQMINDTLLVLNPTKQLLNDRLKAKEFA